MNCMPGASSDGFFLWTSPGPGSYVFDTVGTDLGAGSMGETLSIFSGTDCNATCLVDAQGTDARAFVLGLSGGETLLVQVGSEGPLTSASATGTLTITQHTTPTNDTCATPMVVDLGSHIVNTLAATSTNFDGGGAPCGNVGLPKSDVFLVFTPLVSESVRIDTLSQSIDTVLSVHLGGDCSATCLLTNRKGAPGMRGSRVDLTATAGLSYLIQIGGWNPTVVSDQMIVDLAALPTPPLNDNCSTPTILPGSVGVFTVDTSTATASGFDGTSMPCPPSGSSSCPAPDVFFQWTPIMAGDYDFQASGLGLDSLILNLHFGAGCSAACWGSDTKKPGPSTDARVPLIGAQPGQPYMIQVGSWLWVNTSTNGLLEIREMPLPANDTCLTPEPISGELDVVWDNFHPDLTTTGFDGGAPGICASALNPITSPPTETVQDLFFSWTPECDGNYRIETLASAFVVDTKISFHSGSDCSATCFEFNASPGGSNAAAVVEVQNLVAGHVFLIQVGGAQLTTARGPGTLSIRRIDQPCHSSEIRIGCDPAQPHFQGGSVSLATSHMGSGVGSDLHIEAIDGPPGEFGFLLMSADSSGYSFIQSGILCLQAPHGRYSGPMAASMDLPHLNSLGQFSVGGTLQNLVGTATSTSGSGFDVPAELPLSVGMQIQPGDTWAFQLWYRDKIRVAGDSTNFSNVIEVDF
jgi:hypothetical protein